MRHVTALFPQVGADSSNAATTTDRRIGIPIESPSKNVKNPERMAQIGCVVCTWQRMLSAMIVQVRRYSMEANCRRKLTHSCAHTFTYLEIHTNVVGMCTYYIYIYISEDGGSETNREIVSFRASRAQ